MELKPITGVLVNYYFICKRKLWLFANHLSMEDNSEAVALGKWIDETTFKREKKHIMIDNIINIDFMGIRGYISEVKKSNKMSDADIWQVKYYLYYLKKKGLTDFKAIIHYPKMKKKEIIELSDDDSKKLEEILIDIEKIIRKQTSPTYKRIKICSQCAYFEFCFI